VDTDTFYAEADVLEREVLKPKLLRAFGWAVVHVLAKDWSEDPESVLRRLERRLAGEDEPEAGTPALAAVPAAAPAAAPVPAPGPVAPASAALPGQARYFEYADGTSNKFWHVAVEGSELVVSFGRIGTDGQVKRKPFASADLARREAARLVREKLGKGYVEVPTPTERS
jgi:predicted DNA-binding WGR domain protein